MFVLLLDIILTNTIYSVSSLISSNSNFEDDNIEFRFVVAREPNLPKTMNACSNNKMQ
jgi:hypothetical protein